MAPRRSAASAALKKIKDSYDESILSDNEEPSPVSTPRRKSKTKPPKSPPTPKPKPRKVISFLDLPRPIRDQIYRHHLVSSDMIKYRAWSWEYYDEPALLHVRQPIAVEAAQIYFAENHFHLGSFTTMRAFFYDVPNRYARLLQRVTFDWTESLATNAIAKLRRATKLVELNVCINEVTLLREHLKETSRPITPQMNLKILLIKGMDALRKMHNIKSVRFQASSQGRQQGSGPIPGGVLETIVASQMMGPKIVQKPQDCEGSFPFLRLPPEIRNRIYRQALAVDGPFNPSKSTPTSAKLSGQGRRRGLRKDKPVPHSVLSLVQVNRQIYEESVSLFYHINHLEFNYPLEFAAFVNEIDQRRRVSIREITFWHRSTREGGFYTVDFVFPMLESLPSLKQLHINCDTTYGVIDKFPGFQTLMKLRGSLEISIRDLDLEKDLEYDEKLGLFNDQSRPRVRERELKEFIERLNKTVNGKGDEATAEAQTED